MYHTVNLGPKAMEFYERYLKPMQLDLWDILYYMIHTKSAVPYQKWLTYNRYVEHDLGVRAVQRQVRMPGVYTAPAT
jgi:hypothetical protein